MFRTVTYKTMPGTIARINRDTADLMLNPVYWRNLNPAQKRFVLLHEKGHFQLQSPSERDANNYAVREFLKTANTDQEFADRLHISSQMTKYSDMPLIDTAINTVGGIFNVLPAIGVGSKSRIAETEAQTKALQESYQANAKLQSQRTEQTIIIIAVIAIVLIVSFVLYSKMKKK